MHTPDERAAGADQARRRARRLLYAVAAAQDAAWGLALYAVPYYAKQELKESFRGLTLLAFLPAVAYTAAALCSGRLSERLRPERLALAGGLLCAGAFLLAGRAGSLWPLLGIYAVALAGLGTFWPAVQVRLAEHAPPGRLARVSGIFNISWSVGILGGGLVAGTVTEWAKDVRLCFVLVAALTALAALLQMLVPSRPARAAGAAEGTAERGPGGQSGQSGPAAPSTPSTRSTSSTPAGAAAAPVDDATRERFRLVALVVNLVGVGSNATLRQFAPELGDAGRYDALHLGLLHGAMSAVIVATFVLFTFWRGWRYRPEALLFSPFLVLAGALLMVAGGSYPTHLVGFALSGGAFGISYAASIFYGLDAPRHTGRKVGIHEACVSTGSALLPLAGGGLAVWTGSGVAPYAFLVLAALLLLPALRRVLREREAAP